MKKTVLQSYERPETLCFAFNGDQMLMASVNLTSLTEDVTDFESTFEQF